MVHMAARDAAGSASEAPPRGAPTRPARTGRATLCFTLLASVVIVACGMVELKSSGPDTRSSPSVARGRLRAVVASLGHQGGNVVEGDGLGRHGGGNTTDSGMGGWTPPARAPRWPSWREPAGAPTPRRSLTQDTKFMAWASGYGQTNNQSECGRVVWTLSTCGKRSVSVSYCVPSLLTVWPRCRSAVGHPLRLSLPAVRRDEHQLTRRASPLYTGFPIKSMPQYWASRPPLVWRSA